MNSQKLRDRNELASERSRMASGITEGKSAVITLPDNKKRSQARLGSKASPSSQDHANPSSELAKSVQEMISDIHEIIAKVDEFKIAISLNWRRNNPEAP